MNTILSSPKGDPKNEQASAEGVQETIHEYYPEVNTMDGAEFLDDALRMKDQPLGETTVRKEE